MSGEFDDDELWNYYGPKKVRPPKQDPVPLSSPQEGDAASQNEVPGSGQAPWQRSREKDDAPQRTATTSMPPPWKRSKGHRPFVGDVAIAEMRNKALAPSRLSYPPAPPSRMKYGMAVPFAGVAMMMAIGIVMYKLGSSPSASPQQPASLSSASPRLSSPASSVEVRVGGAQPQQPDEPAKLTVSAADTATAGNSAPALAHGPPTRSEPRRLDTNTIAAKMKTGVELMTYGEVTEARTMFQPVAEAGEGTGAFKLAETYDPIVLAGLRLRKRIMPDLALARTWYERARDLGTLDAQDRISRLAQLPQ
jgi:hypothetical protein